MCQALCISAFYRITRVRKNHLLPQGNSSIIRPRVTAKSNAHLAITSVHVRGESRPLAAPFFEEELVVLFLMGRSIQGRLGFVLASPEMLTGSRTGWTQKKTWSERQHCMIPGNDNGNGALFRTFRPAEQRPINIKSNDYAKQSSYGTH